MKIENIETPRLCLRGFAPEDAPFAISLWNDASTGRWLSDPRIEDIPDQEAYMKTIENLGDALDRCYLVAVDKATKIIIPSELQNLGAVVPSIKELLTDPAASAK